MIKNKSKLLAQTVTIAAVIYVLGYSGVELFESLKNNKIRSDAKIAAAQKEWKDRFPGAYKTRPYTHCNKLGFLEKAYNFGNYIDVSLVTADNNVPIRCKTDFHTTIENAGTTTVNNSSIF